MIKVEKLSKSFGKHEVLKNISTTIAEVGFQLPFYSLADKR